MRFPSAALNQTSSTSRFAGGATHPSLALVGWNRSDVSTAWPGDQLDEEGALQLADIAGVCISRKSKFAPVRGGALTGVPPNRWRCPYRQAKILVLG